MTMRPGMLRSCSCRSVRLIPGACWTVVPGVCCAVVLMSASDGCVVLRLCGYRVARLAQRPERGAHLACEELGFFPGGEVTAPVGFAPVHEIGVDLLRP